MRRLILEVTPLARRTRRLTLLTLLLATAPAAYSSWLGQGQAVEASGAILVVLYVMVPLLTVSGVVSSDIHSGEALIWLQKPVRPEILYLGRAWAGAFLSLLLIVGATVACAAVILAGDGPDEARRLLNLLPLGVLTALATSSVTFGISGLGTSLDAPLALLYVLVSSAASALHSLLPETLGRVARAAGFPLEELMEVEAWIRGRSAAPGSAALHIAGFCLAWLACGFLATRITMRRPFPRGG